LGVDGKAIKAVRTKSPLSDEKLNSLVALTRELVTERGFVAERIKEQFIENGYDENALMEVLAGIALMTMTNYLDHLNPVAIDPAFQAALN
jgi:alkylhydroperoxidase family enzyme